VAIASLILGILGIVSGFFTVGFGGMGLGLIALILGILGRKKAAAENQPKGMATAGMVLGIVGLALGVIFFVTCSLCVAAVNKSATEMQKQMENDPNFKKSMDDFNKQLQESMKNAEKTGAAPAPAEEKK
jgi:hypothetical protein